MSIRLFEERHRYLQDPRAETRRELKHRTPAMTRQLTARSKISTDINTLDTIVTTPRPITHHTNTEGDITRRSPTRPRIAAPIPYFLARR
jgi:hypothetical protein